MILMEMFKKAIDYGFVVSIGKMVDNSLGTYVSIAGNCNDDLTLHRVVEIITKPGVDINEDVVAMGVNRAIIALDKAIKDRHDKDMKECLHESVVEGRDRTICLHCMWSKPKFYINEN